MEDNNSRNVNSCNHHDLCIHNQLMQQNFCPNPSNMDNTQQVATIQCKCNMYTFSPTSIRHLAHCVHQQVPCLCQSSNNFTHNPETVAQPPPSALFRPNCCLNFLVESFVRNPDPDQSQSTPPVDPRQVGNLFKQLKHKIITQITEMSKLTTCLPADNETSDDEDESPEQHIRGEEEKRKHGLGLPSTKSVSVIKKRHINSEDASGTEQPKKIKFQIKKLRQPIAPAPLFENDVNTTVIKKKDSLNPALKKNYIEVSPDNLEVVPQMKNKKKKKKKYKRRARSSSSSCEENVETVYRTQRRPRPSFDSEKYTRRARSSSSCEEESSNKKTTAYTTKYKPKLSFKSKIQYKKKKEKYHKSSVADKKSVNAIPKNSIAYDVDAEQLNNYETGRETLKNTTVIDLTNADNNEKTIEIIQEDVSNNIPNESHLTSKLSEVFQAMSKQVQSDKMDDLKDNISLKPPNQYLAQEHEAQDQLKLLNVSDNIIKVDITTDKLSSNKTQNKLKSSTVIEIKDELCASDDNQNKDSEPHIDPPDLDLSFLYDINVDEVANLLRNCNEEKEKDAMKNANLLDAPHKKEIKNAVQLDSPPDTDGKHCVDAQLSIEDTIQTESEDELEGIKRYMAEMLGIAPNTENKSEKEQAQHIINDVSEVIPNSESKYEKEQKENTINNVIEVIDLTDDQTSAKNDNCNSNNENTSLPTANLIDAVVKTSDSKYCFNIESSVEGNSSDSDVIEILKTEDNLLSLDGEDDLSDGDMSNCGTVLWTTPIKEETTIERKQLPPNEQRGIEDLEDRMEDYFNDKFDVTALISKGLHSNIYQCKDSDNESYAVKVILYPSQVAYSKSKFLTKIQEKKPNGHQFFAYLLKGFGFQNHWCYLMKFQSKNLAQLLESNSCLHVNKVQMLARQLVTAVTVLKNMKVVHGDIKPNHVLLNDGEDHIKLCGFDMAFYCNENIRYYEPKIGSTKNYRAPEVIMGYSADYSVDVWTTALVIYEIATGRKFIGGKNIRSSNEVLYKQMSALGNMPRDVIASSRWGPNHFEGFQFIRKYKRGARKNRKKLIAHFEPTGNGIRKALEEAYVNDWGCHKPKEKRTDDYKKLSVLTRMLEKMLVLHPRRRFDIEAVNTMFQ